MKWIGARTTRLPGAWSLGLLNEHRRLRPSRSMAARGQSLFAVAQKVTKNACPCTPLHPPVLATGGMKGQSNRCLIASRFDNLELRGTRGIIATIYSTVGYSSRIK